MTTKKGLCCDVCSQHIEPSAEYRHFERWTQNIKGNWIDIDICGECWENVTTEDLFDLFGGECREIESSQWMRETIYGRNEGVYNGDFNVF